MVKGEKTNPNEHDDVQKKRGFARITEGSRCSWTTLDMESSGG